jgi:hypothetical protein
VSEPKVTGVDRLAVEVLTALGERRASIEQHRAGDVLQAMITDQSLWCAVQRCSGAR